MLSGCILSAEEVVRISDAVLIEGIDGEYLTLATNDAIANDGTPLVVQGRRFQSAPIVLKADFASRSYHGIRSSDSVRFMPINDRYYLMQRPLDLKVASPATWLLALARVDVQAGTIDLYCIKPNSRSTVTSGGDQSSSANNVESTERIAQFIRDARKREEILFDAQVSAQGEPLWISRMVRRDVAERGTLSAEVPPVGMEACVDLASITKFKIDAHTLNALRGLLGRGQPQQAPAPQQLNPQQLLQQLLKPKQ